MSAETEPTIGSAAATDPSRCSRINLSRGNLHTVTLGCKVNQYETEFVREPLFGIGYRDAVQDEPADVCVVNTCTVTAEGDSKSRHSIRQLAAQSRRQNCRDGLLRDLAPEEVASLEGVAEVVTDKRELPDLLGRFGVVDIPTGISGLANRQRYVKVQDGCMLHCSFCIIPKVRPNLTSRPVEHILDEIQRLQASGYREMILTGIHLGHYGVDFNRGRPKREWTRLSHLVDRIAQLDGDFRIRLSSIEATEVTRELIAAMAAHPTKVCPHLHISLQSGSDRILSRMRRRWGSQRFLDRCRLVRECARRAGAHDRRDRWFSRRNGSRLPRNMPSLRTGGLFQDSCLPVQASPHHAGCNDARPGRSADQSRPRRGG